MNILIRNLIKTLDAEFHTDLMLSSVRDNSEISLLIKKYI